MYNNRGNRPTFRERMIAFMSGRYGQDALYYTLLFVCIVLIIVNAFVDTIIIPIIETLLFIWAIYRFMSRNIYKRQRENEIFLKNVKSPIVAFNALKLRFKYRKTHRFKKCPACKHTLRLPYVKGEHTVRCPGCGERFDVKIR